MVEFTGVATMGVGAPLARLMAAMGVWKRAEAFWPGAVTEPSELVIGGATIGFATMTLARAGLKLLLGAAAAGELARPKYRGVSMPGDGSVSMPGDCMPGRNGDSGVPAGMPTTLAAIVGGGRTQIAGEYPDNKASSCATNLAGTAPAMGTD